MAGGGERAREEREREGGGDSRPRARARAPSGPRLGGRGTRPTAVAGAARAGGASRPAAAGRHGRRRRSPPGRHVPTPAGGASPGAYTLPLPPEVGVADGPPPAAVRPRPRGRRVHHRQAAPPQPQQTAQRGRFSAHPHRSGLASQGSRPVKTDGSHGRAPTARGAEWPDLRGHATGVSTTIDVTRAAGTGGVMARSPAADTRSGAGRGGALAGRAWRGRSVRNVRADGGGGCASRGGGAPSRAAPAALVSFPARRPKTPSFSAPAAPPLLGRSSLAFKRESAS